ncbi:MAG: glycosyltransferase family 4 protein [Fervidobacterium sp.]
MSSSKKRILVVSQYFYPEQFRINDICVELKRRGYEINVVTGIPNYPQGKFYKGYGLFKKTKEQYNGVPIRRIPLIPRGKNYLTLSLNYISFIVSGFFWQLFSRLKVDYVFCFGTSPITQALPGIWFSKRKKIPCYLYLQDLWPQSFEYITGTRNKTILHIVGKISDYVYRNCTVIFVPSKGFATVLVERGIPERKIVYWPQYAEDFFKPLSKMDLPEIPSDSFNVVFTGNVGLAQGLDILPKSARIIRNVRPDVNIKFVVVGDGRARQNLIEEAEKMKVDDMFVFLPHKPAVKIPEIISACDVAFLSLRNDPVFKMTIPAKLQTYLACGIPIVSAIEGEAAEIIKEANAGISSAPGDELALAQNILSLYDMDKNELRKLGLNARMYYENNFEKNKLFCILENYLRD